ncbi:ABC transporter permease [Hypericibacter sp.]|uniref:ABC transporter permease n=1 Tax=Hypericibacter sp. TaxID=2705401 RepID=UPI003D6CD7B1
MATRPHRTLPGRLWHGAYLTFCVLVFFFLIAPLIVVVPLSFNAQPFFTFTEGMLRFEAAAYSLQWYRDILANDQWLLAIRNSVIIATCATALATTLGTLAAVGLSRPTMPLRSLVMTILISPMIIPIIIVSAGMYFFYSQVGLAQTMLGIILAHAVLGTPFVVITVTATMMNFDYSLTRAAASLGAPPLLTFFRVVLPLILPGVVSGALFAFAASFDEVVVVQFLAAYDQRTIPLQMWAGIREQISPTILAVATLLIVVSALILTAVELLRARVNNQRGVKTI